MSALVFLAPGFEEIEAITVIDILRRAEIDTLVAGLAPNPITAARHTKHLAEVRLEDVDPAREFEVVVLPGGAEGAKHLAASPLVGDWLARQRERGQWVAAICAAPTALLAHGWLRPEQKITAIPRSTRNFPELKPWTPGASSWMESSSPALPPAAPWNSPTRLSANCAVRISSAR